MLPWGEPGSSQELWGWGWGWRLLGIPGQGAGHQGRERFKGKNTFEAAISFGGFNCVLGHEAEVFLLEKTRPHWNAETRGAGTWDNAQVLLDRLLSFPPALEFSTLFILN